MPIASGSARRRKYGVNRSRVLCRIFTRLRAEA
jgi:hypothetical protein